MTWHVLEWNALDNDIALYEWETAKTDIAEVWEEVGESLHNYGNVLVMDDERFLSFLKAVEPFQNRLKGGKQGNG